MSEGPRYAIYWAPEPDHGLSAAGAAWLGRDAATLTPPAARPRLEALDELTEAPRLYGFHATLKAPMRLHPDVSRADLLSALGAVAAAVPPFPLPALAVADWHGFLCLRETRESVALQAFADVMVAGLDHLRAPPSPRELAYRRAAGLSGAGEANLLRWGYPDVFAAWFFHMTLTRRLSAEEMQAARPAAEAWFGSALAQPLRVGDVCLFEQPSAGRPFVLTDRVMLGGRSDRPARR